MEVAMENSPPVLSSLAQSFPRSPTASRKRSFQAVEGFSSDTKPQASNDTSDHENHVPKENGLSGSVEIAVEIESNESAGVIEGLTESSDPIERGRTATKETTPVNSILATISTPNSIIPTGSSTQQPSGAAAPNAQKKRKLSPASKEAKRIEKEAKERQKLEEKAKKEEERRQKEEEKKKRDAEREEERKKKEEKRKLKEEERLAKEGEKRKKEEEKMKKERSQMRLNAFFSKPSATQSAPSSSSTNQGSPRKVATDDSANSNGPRSESSETISDYRREFPNFFLQSHTQVAPLNRFERDAEALQLLRENLDKFLKTGGENLPEVKASKLSEIFNIIPYKRRQDRHIIPVKEILLKLQESQESQDSFDPAKPAPKPQDLLRQVTMKTLKFGEDVRPPYHGTWTRHLSKKSATKLSRNPFERALPDTNYDYDSEAEWEEPEEGEDLDSEGEEELSEDGDDDMDGFLDDDDDNQVDGKRRLIVGDLDPVCSGVHWQEAGIDSEFESYRIEVISEAAQLPIDPFSSTYWEKPKASEHASTKSSMPAPAIPSGRSTLHAYMSQPSQCSSANGTISQTGGQTGVASTAQPTNKAKRSFPPEQLAEFKQVVEGSDLTKTGLIEILKKRFPKVSKDVLKDTLGNVASRVGQKEADKKWVCK